MVGTVFLHGDGPLKGAVPNGQFDVIGRRILEKFGGLVTLVACNHLSIDL